MERESKGGVDVPHLTDVVGTRDGAEDGGLVLLVGQRLACAVRNGRGEEWWSFWWHARRVNGGR